MKRNLRLGVTFFLLEGGATNVGQFEYRILTKSGTNIKLEEPKKRLNQDKYQK